MGRVQGVVGPEELARELLEARGDLVRGSLGQRGLIAAVEELAGLGLERLGLLPVQAAGAFYLTFQVAREEGREPRSDLREGTRIVKGRKRGNH
jgi:hypothetical protein